MAVQQSVAQNATNYHNGASLEMLKLSDFSSNCESPNMLIYNFFVTLQANELLRFDTFGSNKHWSTIDRNFRENFKQKLVQSLIETSFVIPVIPTPAMTSSECYLTMLSNRADRWLPMMINMP